MRRCFFYHGIEFEKIVLAPVCYLLFIFIKVEVVQKKSSRLSNFMFYPVF